MTGNSNAKCFLYSGLACRTRVADFLPYVSGIVGGFFPALRATRLSPLAAIQNE